jgi:hypothetical protein
MDSIKELILTIKKRPAMYITRNSISCLKAYLDGWYFRSPESVSDGELMGDFQDWIVHEYKIKSEHSWDAILLFYSNDEYGALQLFFRKFDLFLLERGNNH